MTDAKALFLINNHQAKVAKDNVVGEQPMSADNDVDLTRARSRIIASCSFGERNRESISTVTGKAAMRLRKVSKCC